MTPMMELYDDNDEREVLGDDVDAPEPPDNDFSDLEDLLASATAATVADKRLKEARKRLGKVSRSGHEASGDESQSLIAEIRELEMGRVWFSVGSVARFHRQTCALCSSQHVWFEGWMTEQTHASDPNARRYIRELATGLAERIQPERADYHESVCDVCYNCIETVIAVDTAVQGREM